MGGRGTLICSYIRLLKLLNFNIFGGFRKLNIFRGMKILWIFFFGGGGGGVITKLGYILGEMSMHFRVFSEGQGTEWRIFLGCLKFKYLFGVL